MANLSPQQMIHFLTNPGSKNAKLLAKKYDDLVDKSEWSKSLTNPLNVSGPGEEHKDLGSLGEAQNISKGAPAPSLDVIIGYSKRFQVHNLYAASTAIQEMDLKDIGQNGLSNLFQRVIKGIPMAIRQSVERECALLFTYGRTGVTIPASVSPYLDVLTGDGLPLFSNAHTIPGGVYTYSNVTSALIGPGLLALTTAYNNFNSYVNSTNYPITGGDGMPVRPTHIVAASNLIPTWHEVLETQYEIDTNNNNISTVPYLTRGNVKIMEHRLFPDNFHMFRTSAADADPQNYSVQHVRVGGLIVENYEKPDPKQFVYSYRSRERFQPGTNAGYGYFVLQGINTAPGT